MCIIAVMKGERIQHLQDLRNIGNKQLLAELNTTGATLSRWKNNINEPDDETKLALAAALKTTVSYLIGESDDPNPGKDRGIIAMDFNHSSGSIISVPIFERAYSACCGIGFPDAGQIYACAEDYIDMPAGFLGQISEDPEHRPFMIYAEGDSMVQAGITDGAQLLINPAENIYDGNAALVEYGRDRNIAVKRVYWLNGSGIEIRSACGDGWKRTFSLEEQQNGELRLIGKVVWYGNKPKNG